MAQTGTPSPMRAEIGATLRLAGPLALANLLQMAVYASDVIFVARLGQEALAASSLAVSIFMLVNWGLLGLTGAAAPLIAAELGHKRHSVREVRRTMRMALWLSLLCAAVGMVVCQFGHAIMLATGQDPKIAAMAQEFLTILSFALLPMIVGNVLRTFVSTMGKPVFATLITALAILVNVIGNFALVFGHFGFPALGLPGSALSSLITAVITMLAYIVVIQTDRRMRRTHIWGRIWRPEWSRLKTMVRLGIPIALTVMAEGGLFGSAAYLMGNLGAAELAAHTIALQVAAAFFQIPYGIGQAATIRVGYHYGAGDRQGVARAGLAVFGVCLAAQVIAIAAMLGAPRLIISAYVDPDAAENAQVVAFALQYLVIAAAFQLFDGVQTVAAGALRGLQDTKWPMIIALSGYWLVGFAVAAWLGLGTPLEGVGVWIGLMAGLVVVAALLGWRWWRRERLGLVPA
ncbi:MATE family efflux transporter [Novosphingobium sp. TH158]|uniref:MATE family efflux transporter n=1 Tax=Novosphingobium sp. TH158 TaxID=2067455 RepID=UPI000C7B28E0|nr:MATE family efflux transporter [Novosphingobium sp. TH158]PLK27546.1 MATE family efflux transporter [Novosphingobium sp. TH158]